MINIANAFGSIDLKDNNKLIRTLIKNGVAKFKPDDSIQNNPIMAIVSREKILITVESGEQYMATCMVVPRPRLVLLNTKVIVRWVMSNKRYRNKISVKDIVVGQIINYGMYSNVMYKGLDEKGQVILQDVHGNIKKVYRELFEENAEVVV